MTWWQWADEIVGEALFGAVCFAAGFWWNWRRLQRTHGKRAGRSPAGTGPSPTG